MKKVTISIMPKQGVLDPQGKVIQTSLHALGFADVADVYTGKTIELYVEADENIHARVSDMCDKLLANPVMEDYHVDVEEVVRQ